MVLVGCEADGLSIPTWAVGKARLPSVSEMTLRAGSRVSDTTVGTCGPTSRGPAWVGAEERCALFANLPRGTLLHRAKH